jgi:flagellar L-ring protein precursor FlgH
MKRTLSQTILAALLAAGAVTDLSAQSLWQDSTARPMFADKRACRVGDILTIIVQETSSANKNNATKTEKSSSWTAAITSFLFPGLTPTYKGATPAMDYSSDLKHSGSGAINNSQTMVAQLAVKVIDVLPNNNLIIEGKRETSFSDEKQTIILHGIVRTEDVSAANTVLSFNVADASIQIEGKGSVSDSQNKGWFTRILDKVNPF